MADIEPMPQSNVENLSATPEMWNEWRQYLLKSFGIEMPDSSMASFAVLLAELKDWNEKINLVSFRSDREVIFRHFADSLAGLKLINTLGGQPGAKIIDIGTGAGFPGTPVYIASDFHDITLVESITKKTSFIAHIKETLKLDGLKIINDRAENLGQDKLHRASYDFVLSRAVSKLSPNLEIALPLLKKGGYALIYKTEKSASEEEMNAARNALKELTGVISERFCYTIPYESLNYCVVAFKKLGETPKVYPRRAGTPEKKPL
jgi:16S rRNA (guanine527-N7)-methyltransferase